MRPFFHNERVHSQHRPCPCRRVAAVAVAELHWGHVKWLIFYYIKNLWPNVRVHLRILYIHRYIWDFIYFVLYRCYSMQMYIYLSLKMEGSNNMLWYSVKLYLDSHIDNEINVTNTHTFPSFIRDPSLFWKT